MIKKDIVLPKKDDEIELEKALVFEIPIHDEKNYVWGRMLIK